MTLSTADKFRIMNIMGRYAPGDLLSLSVDEDFTRNYPDLRVDVRTGELLMRVADIGVGKAEGEFPMAHVQFKPGAAVARLAPAGIRILGAIDAAAHASGVVITITSGSEDRGRAPSDPHMTGEAFDISVAGFTAQQVVAIYRYLRQFLNAAFTVLYEVPALPTATTIEGDLLRGIAYVNPSATAPHIHIQRRKGTTWPADDGRATRV